MAPEAGFSGAIWSNRIAFGIWIHRAATASPMWKNSLMTRSTWGSGLPSPRSFTLNKRCGVILPLLGSIGSPFFFGCLVVFFNEDESAVYEGSKMSYRFGVGQPGSHSCKSKTLFQR